MTPAEGPPDARTPESQKLRVAELFAGIGGVAGGFLDTGAFELVFLNDADGVARQAFIDNFPEYESIYHHGFAEKVTGSLIREVAGGGVDGILGCPPCQALSAAGTRDQADGRNRLVWEMKKLLDELEPRFFVIENVPAFLQHSQYRGFAKAVSTRYLLAANTLNAAAYGIPQLRRRAVIVGVRRDLGVAPSLPPPTHGGRGAVYAYVQNGFVRPGTTAGRNVLNLRVRGPLPQRPLVTLKSALGDLPPVSAGEAVVEYAAAPTTRYQRQMRSGARGLLVNHQGWEHRPETVAAMSKVPVGECPRLYGTSSRNERYFSQAYARLHPDGLATTLTTNFHNPGSGRYTHYAQPRTLTLREALRLQGFPDTFRLEVSEDGPITYEDAKRLVGNAFPRLLAAAIGRHVASLVRPTG